jgi:hypothetical protein
MRVLMKLIEMDIFTKNPDRAFSEKPTIRAEAKGAA